MKRERLVKYSKIGISVVLAGAFLYLYLIPTMFSSEKFINKSLNFLIQKTNYSINVKNPEFKTYLSPKILIKVDNISIYKNNMPAFESKNFISDLAFNFNELIINRISSDFVFADINKFTQNISEKKENSSDNKLNIDFYNSVLELKNSKIIYNLDDSTSAEIIAKLNLNSTQKDFRPINFTLETKIKNPNNDLNLLISDNNKVYIKNKTLFIDNCPININNSQIFVKSESTKESGFNPEFNSQNFKAIDLYNLIASNLIIKNGKKMLMPVKDFSGSFDFGIKFDSKKYSGQVNLQNFGFKIVNLNSLPVTLCKGDIKIDEENIIISDVIGFYGKTKTNKLVGEGNLKNYTDSLESNFVVKTELNNEFTKNYLSVVTGIPIEISGKADSRLIIETKNDDIDINISAKLPSGNDILIAGASLTPKNYDRALNAIMNFKNGILNVKTIDYYIAETINKNSKIKPILSFNGIIDCKTPTIITKKFELDIQNPLPSEFLNLFSNRKMFKGGNISGKVAYLNINNTPKIKGKMNVENIKIPPLKIHLKSAQFYTDREMLHLVANGKFKHSNFDFEGNILNKLTPPYTIKDLELGLDYVNIEQLLNTMNSSGTKPKTQTDEIETGDCEFDLKNLIVENCIFKLNKGKYKEIEIGNLNANLTLDKNEILELNAPKFNIADGISSLKVYCDLKNKKYELKLGAKDVDADKMAISILNLKKEISGKASGIINLSTDNSCKLNGFIKFNINNGTIQKIGLAEYLMKFAAIFRNPVVMISPSTIADIVNIPEGKFDTISGDLQIKDNIINLIRIKSASPNLSAYVVGMYNLENNDAILRIYTKFSNKNKGFYGFLRNISLNSIANRFVKINNNELNYYESEISQIPLIEGEEKDCQIFLTKIDGDIQNNNFLSSLKKIK